MDKLQVIDKLEGERNWVSWKFDVELQLSVNKVMPVVIGEVCMPETLTEGADEAALKVYSREKRSFEEADAVARFIIGSSLRPEPKQHILTCKSSKEMWDTLHSVYEQRNERRLDLLYTQLFSYHKDAGDDIATHVSKLQRIWQDLQNELKAEKVELPKSMLLNRILNTLPSEYLEFKNAWESVPQSERNIAGLTERLRLHEQRMNEVNKGNLESSDVALVAKTASNLQNNEKMKEADDTVSQGDKKGTKWIPKCYYCGKPGHFKRDCRKWKYDTGGQHEAKIEKSAQAFLSVTSMQTEDVWLIDSGASHHISSRLDWFSNYSPFVSPRSLRLGDGRVMYAYGEGEIQVEMLVAGRWQHGYLTKVWYVPDGAQNLFSAGSALDKGLTEFADREHREFRNKDGQVVAVGVRQPSGLYRLLMRIVSPVRACVAVKENELLQIWHERLGHQNKRHVQKFLKQQGIDVTLDSEFCDACMYGKMHRLSFGTRKNRPMKAGELINADVCGPMPEKSLGGNRYFVDFKDDFTKYRTVYFLKEKSEVKEKLAQFLAEVNTVGHKVKELMTDGGTEFNNADVLKITQGAGLYHRKSMPYTPEQNGAAERDNRILVEAARTMLHASGLPETLWAEAVNTAAYVINRTGPSAVEDKTPYELWFNKIPSIEHLKIFGTECFIHIPKQKRRKFDKKAKKGYLVGYCGDRDGYRVWIPGENNVYLSRDVVFKTEFTSVVSCGHSGSLSLPDIEPENYEESIETGEDEERPQGDRNLRDRALIRKPVRSDDYVMVAEYDEPETLQEALSSDNHCHWDTGDKRRITGT